MSQPSYAATPPTSPSPSTRPRPRRRWFVVGALLLALAAVVLAVGLFTTVSRGTETDVEALVRGGGQPVGAGVPVGEERMLFVPQGEPAPRCRVTDADGRELPLRTPSMGTTVTTGGVTWTGFATFTSPTESIGVGCATTVERLRVGSPLGSGFVLGLLVTVLLPVVLGLAGVAVLVTTTVLWLTRAPGPSSAPSPSGPPPPWTTPRGR